MSGSGHMSSCVIRTTEDDIFAVRALDVFAGDAGPICWERWRAADVDYDLDGNIVLADPYDRGYCLKAGMIQMGMAERALADALGRFPSYQTLGIDCIPSGEEEDARREGVRQVISKNEEHGLLARVIPDSAGEAEVFADALSRATGWGLGQEEGMLVLYDESEMGHPHRLELCPGWLGRTPYESIWIAASHHLHDCQLELASGLPWSKRHAELKEMASALEVAVEISDALSHGKAINAARRERKSELWRLEDLIIHVGQEVAWGQHSGWQCLPHAAAWAWRGGDDRPRALGEAYGRPGDDPRMLIGSAVDDAHDRWNLENGPLSPRPPFRRFANRTMELKLIQGDLFDYTESSMASIDEVEAVVRTAFESGAAPREEPGRLGDAMHEAVAEGAPGLDDGHAPNRTGLEER